MIRRIAVSVCCLVLLPSLAGCKTPIEIKNASKKQLQLIQELDVGVANLQKALTEHHRLKMERAYEEAYILIARQAIALAVPNGDGPAITADRLFATHRSDVQPWIDDALISADLEDQIAELQESIGEEQDQLIRGRLEIEKQDLERRQSQLQQRPPEIADLEEVILDDLDSESKALESVSANLGVLRAQIAVMRAMAEHVDAWLAIDLAPTAEQINTLRTELSAAAGHANGGGQ